MNKQNDTLRYNNYNSKFIIKNIFVTFEKHFFMISLNYHFDIFRKTFRYVDNNFDLTTVK